MMFPLLEAILFSFPPILRTVSTRRRGEDTERVEQIWFFLVCVFLCCGSGLEAATGESPLRTCGNARHCGGENIHPPAKK